MPPYGQKLFSRDEILDGLPARRAGALLYAIENRTAMLVARSRRTMASYRTDRTDAERERAFLQALADGRDPPLRPTIQDINRYAPAWADLVPPDVSLRAELAHRLGEKYRFSRSVAGGLRAALGLDDPAVDAAHRRLHDAPVTSVYAETLTLGERLAWARAELAYRLENLPPFWTAFSLTLTQTVGAGVIALPIAMAGIGPLAGVGLLVAFGVVNAITIVALTEAITRTGSMRYGSSYFGRLVADLLGRAGSVTLTIALLVLSLLAFFALATGFGSVLESATRVPAWGSVALLFAIVIWVVRRDSLDSTVASALVIGAVNIGLMLALIGIGLANMRPELMGSGGIPPFDGRPFDGAILGLVFGVVLSAYFGHASAGNAAKVVLRRDPSGRSLLWGTLAAMLAVIVINSGVILAVNGAVEPARLAGFEGTAITPLAQVAGPAVLVVGSIYVVLAMGLGSLHMALGLYNQTGEMLDWWASRRPGTTAARGWLRTALRLSPLFSLFVVLEALLLTGGASFAGPLSILGALIVPLLGGAFPMLLLAASRRRGEFVPATAWRFVGTPPVVWGVFVLYVAAIALHALVIWQTPAERLVALAAGLIMLAVAVAARRGGAFRPRTVIQLRADEHGDRAAFSVVVAGKPVQAAVRVDGADALAAGWDGQIADARALRSVDVTLPANGSDEIKVWTHRLTAAGDSEPWPATIDLGGDGRTPVMVGREGASVIVRRDGAADLQIALDPVDGIGSGRGSVP